MLSDESLLEEPPQKPEIMIWRLMVDAKFQGRGIGKRAVEQVIDHVKLKAASPTLLVSYEPGPGCPEPFYRQLGFKPNGDIDEGEIVMELLL
jgi:diamine N-acetyltransferase